MIKAIALTLAPFAALFAIGAYDMSEQTCEQYTSVGFLTGKVGTYERCTGRLGMTSDRSRFVRLATAQERYEWATN